jgi:UDP-N-acetyl-D-glucosamine dehydrogenase
MIEASMMINDRMPEYCVDRVMRMLNDRKKSLNGSKIFALGVSYKQDIDDCREIPAIRVIEVLIKFGAEVKHYDPYVSSCFICDKEHKSEP